MSVNKSLNNWNRLLVANRGEIAIRVLRAGYELGLRTIGIYTYEDRYSLHRYKADESYQIGNDEDALKPYLDIEEIIALAKRVKADAIHPGYGFLSENVDFVARCQAEGIVFIGPSVSAMEALGNKVRGKELAASLGVPLIKGSKAAVADYKIGLEEAKRVGFPVLLKASAGGGGRGMRVVRSEQEFATAFMEAQNEAERAFGDSSIFLEQFIDNPKHIEVQILGDQYGNLVHLFERDCSVQRRFQKVVELAPAPNLKQETRELLYDYSLKMARKVGYYNAGTFEYLVDANENIAFIEVNPRIQVEHTVTEEVTGIDLVRSQILIAQGYALTSAEIGINNQSDISCHGFAIQCRITSENPENDFRPDYGRLVAYRSPGGFGIRLDAGSAYTGAVILPFFDSLLVKVTSHGRTLEDAARRLWRALHEFRVRGVKTNIDFLINVLSDPEFKSGNARVNFIKDHPELLKYSQARDGATRILSYLAEVAVNGNPDVQELPIFKGNRKALVPEFDRTAKVPEGSKDRLKKVGRELFLKELKDSKEILYTDTTFRDAHQSLLATRIRTYDLLKIARSFAYHHPELFSMEVWGGATFDVAMRFLQECPWRRLELLREAIPNILLQMLIRGSNAVGYTAYPDNLIQAFIVKAAEKGIDIFRIFDSMNWLDAMKVSIKTVREETEAIAEVCICYTGDITNPERKKYDLNYYLDLARRIEDQGAHILAIKDMAGLLKPKAATELITALKKSLSIPIHLHTHDTSSIQAATYLMAVDAGVEIIDVAIASMSGLTSQPNFNSIVAMLETHPRGSKVDLNSLNKFSNYWEVVREDYSPFESELKSGTAEVYEHEIPGGQYSNLLPQARSLGLENKFDQIKQNYQIVNRLLGDIVKVTPSSKVVGDVALFMTSNNLTEEDLVEKAAELSFPESLKSLFKGDLGQAYGGFPELFKSQVLKGEASYTCLPNEHLKSIDLEQGYIDFQSEFGSTRSFEEYLSYLLYPKVYRDYINQIKKYGQLSALPTRAFFYPLQIGQEIMVDIAEGKTLVIELRYIELAKANGFRSVHFRLNGQARTIEVRDQQAISKIVINRKAETANQIGAPLQGKLSQVLVKAGEQVKKDQALFVIEAMKMETIVSSPRDAIILDVLLKPGMLVQGEDLVLELK